MPVRAVYDITGIVQGVGFRPAIYRSAEAAHLSGHVVNCSGTVRLTLEGSAQDIDRYIAALPANLPVNCRVDRVELLSKSTIDDEAKAAGFFILPSHTGDLVRVVIPPDLRICPDCAHDIMNPHDRRYGYAFTTCTNCGPRYTLVESMPYDRERTTMADFTMCPACRKEYENPADRRFHAETIACPACGPSLRLEDRFGVAVPGAPLPTIRQHLRAGDIAAVRGIGGFLLAADPFNRATLQRLRSAKDRPHKPFAVMAPDLAALRKYCLVPPEAESLLSSPEAPIVILDVNPAAVASGRLPIDLISPDTMTMGAMLPTSPLHTLLFEPVGPDPLPRFELLVMTSGNRRGEPICLHNDEARDRLRDIADLFLLHDRRIQLRNDDSVCVLRCGRPQVWRRARGYAPGSISLRHKVERCVLAMGAGLKNAIAIGFEDRIVLSPHVGDLETPEAIEGMAAVVHAFPGFLGRTPEIVAVDLHPDMPSTRAGADWAAAHGVPLITVQHHHAHAAACMAEHGLDRALAICFDGTGLGPDGTIWGAELLDVDTRGYQRRATFVAAPLPGGDAAVQQPVRQLVARWLEAGFDIPEDWLARLGVTPEQIAAWGVQCSKKINTPVTHAAGRLFDAFSALLGLPPDTITYEGQAAIRLESAARRCAGAPLPEIPFSTREAGGMLLVDWSEAFTRFKLPTMRGTPEPWAAAFHHAVARAATAMLDYALSRSACADVVLTGGVFMNRILTDSLSNAMEERGLTPHLHRQSPPNDGCIALGQAFIAGRGKSDENE